MHDDDDNDCQPTTISVNIEFVIVRARMRSTFAFEISLLSFGRCVRNDVNERDGDDTYGKTNYERWSKQYCKDVNSIVWRLSGGWISIEIREWNFNSTNICFGLNRSRCRGTRADTSHLLSAVYHHLPPSLLVGASGVSLTEKYRRPRL